MLVLLHRKIGGLALNGIWFFLVRLMFASAVMGISCWSISLIIKNQMVIDSLTSRLLSVFLPMSTGLLILLLMYKLLRVEELDQLLDSILRR